MIAKQTITNIKSLTIRQWLTVALVGIFFTVAPACLRQWKQVDTPTYFTDRGVPPKVSLADTPLKQSQIRGQFTFAMSEWDANEVHSEEQIQFAEGIIDVAKDPKTLMSLGLNPSGGILSTLLLLGGLVTPVPGHAKSKRDSYNKGTQDALKAVEVGKALLDNPDQP